MSTQITRPFSAYGLGQPSKSIFPDPIVTVVDPTANDKGIIGQQWINTLTGDFFVLTNIIAGVPTWTTMSNAGGLFASITVNPGDITVTAGDIIVDVGDITATAGSITAGANLVAGGSITAGTTITATAGDITATLGDFVATNGNVIIKEDTITGHASSLVGLKSRAGGIITSGDALGAVIFAGSDGVTAAEGGAGISVVSTGTIGVGRVPAFMVFATTPDAVSAPIDRLTIPADGGLVIDAPTTATTPPLVLPGPVNIYTGAGVPANGLAINVGDLYINTTAATAATRLYIASAANTWVHFTANA